MSISFQDISLELTDGIRDALTGATPDTTVTYADWYLPSEDALALMYSILHLSGLGNFNSSTPYWTSSEGGAAAAISIYFIDGMAGLNLKGEIIRVRACRSFTSTTNYNLRDIGPSGGLIFWKSVNDYLEAAPIDCLNSAWSNITNLTIGTTGTAVGTGQANTTAIIGQVGHTASAAKICDELSIDVIIPGIVSSGSISVNGSDIPVYVTVPKIAPAEYVYIGGVLHTEDGTKDDFMYSGTVQIRVTVDNLHTAEKKKAQEIMNAVRGMLKPGKATVFTMTNFTCIVFSHESYNELVGQSEGGLRIDLIDLYSFILE